MGRHKKNGPQKIDSTKSCRCGSGFYCHRHLRYGTLATEEGDKKLFKIKPQKQHKGRGNQSGAGGHN